MQKTPRTQKPSANGAGAPSSDLRRFRAEGLELALDARTRGRLANSRHQGSTIAVTLSTHSQLAAADELRDLLKVPRSAVVMIAGVGLPVVLQFREPAAKARSPKSK